MESDEELPLFEIKLEDEIFIPNRRVKQMTKEELLQNIEEQKSKNTERCTKTSLNNTWRVAIGAKIPDRGWKRNLFSMLIRDSQIFFDQ